MRYRSSNIFTCPFIIADVAMVPRVGWEGRSWGEGDITNLGEYKNRGLLNLVWLVFVDFITE